MAKIYAGLLAGYGALPVIPPEAGQGVNAYVRVFRQVITLAAQPTTDTQVIARVPNGYLVLGHRVVSSVSLGASTIAIGTVATPAKYKAAAVFTAVDTPTDYLLASIAGGVPLTADEEQILTVGVAALPGAGTLVIYTYASKP